MKKYVGFWRQQGRRNEIRDWGLRYMCVCVCVDKSKNLSFGGFLLRANHNSAAAVRPVPSVPSIVIPLVACFPSLC